MIEKIAIGIVVMVFTLIIISAVSIAQEIIKENKENDSGNA